MTRVIAHRGASRRAPENTVAAFELAVELGADMVELDVRVTLDGALVVHHDSRLADGRVIVECRRDELPVHVPTLAEALEACEPIGVNVEIKNNPAEPDFDPGDHVARRVIAALAELGDDERWLVSSFRTETIDACRAARPSIATAQLVVDPRTVSLDDVARAGHVAVHPYYAFVDAALVASCRTVGLAVNPWTCDEPDEIDRLVRLGIDGVCTNVPDVAIAVRDAVAAEHP